jgi:hypothetical protein
MDHPTKSFTDLSQCILNLLSTESMSFYVEVLYKKTQHTYQRFAIHYAFVLQDIHPFSVNGTRSRSFDCMCVCARAYIYIYIATV